MYVLYVYSLYTHTFTHVQNTINLFRNSELPNQTLEICTVFVLNVVNRIWSVECGKFSVVDLVW